MNTEGIVFDISRASLHDGQGIRTVVYLKGCSLRCKWCHNPEGISFSPQLLYAQDKCISCGQCRVLCPQHHTGEGYVQEGCIVCGKCADFCPNEALTVCGKKMTAQEVFEQIKKDIHFYERSGGGVTFSGGECFLQPAFLKAVASLCREAGIHTTAETALYYKTEYLQLACEYMDAMFADLKIMDTKLHQEYTGAENALILQNLKVLSENHRNVTVRIPMVPNVSDTDENLKAAALFLNDCGKGIRAVELLKYNNLAENKYRLLGKEEPVFLAQPQTDAVMQQKRAWMRHILREDIAVL